MPTAPSTEEAFQTFMSRLHESGLRQALRYLLELTEYRYIGIFRVDDAEMAHAVVHYDRRDPAQTTLPPSPIGTTFCCYVRDSRGVFTIADSATDQRVAGHPKRGHLRAYCGVPILTAEGDYLGTLCHYDERPLDPAQIDLPLMLQVCSALARLGAVPPTPST